MSELKKILYVEDQKDIQMITKVALESISHFELKICDGGEQALECMAECSPDLILLDVMMPGLDGPGTMIEMRKQEELKSIPVIFMTAKVLPDEVDELMSLGALGVISKPFDPVILGAQIQEIWDRQQS